MAKFWCRLYSRFSPWASRAQSMRPAAVGVQVLGAAQWLTALAADRRDGLDQRDQLGDVVAVAAGGDRGERDAVRLDDRWCLLPALPRSTGDGPVAGPPFIARMGLESTAAREKSSKACSPPTRRAADRAGAARPWPRSSPSRSPVPGAELPADPGVQHEQDPAQHLAAIQTLTTRTSRTSVAGRLGSRDSDDCGLGLQGAVRLPRPWPAG